MFAKIVAWFVAMLLFSIAAFYGTSIFLASRSRQQAGFPRLLRYLGDEAARTYALGGSADLSSYFERLREALPGEFYLIDPDGHDVLTGSDRRELLAHASTPRPYQFWAPRAGTALVQPVGGGSYRFVAVARPPVDPVSAVPFYGLILLTVVGLCWMLTVQLASPLRELKSTVQRFGAGDLSARAKANRRDEYGDVARAFNTMAERLETLVTAERRLLQDISHELRSPLARLGFAVELARTSSDREGALKQVKKDIDRLAALVSQLLQMTRAEGDPAAQRNEPVDLTKLMSDVVADAWIEADARKVRLRFTGASEYLVPGDAELLRRAFENVLRNAIRYAPEGSEVEVEARQEGGEAVISIRDTGPGVPESEIGRIFEPFYRVDRSRDSATGGIGLGLAIAYRAIRLHHGSITAANASPGLRITLRVPFRQSLALPA